MKKLFVLTGIGAGLVFAVLAASFCIVCLPVGRDDEPAWTTRSKAASVEFEEGLEDLRRFYWHDAVVHLERAVKLDPKFAVAKLYLSYVTPRDRPEYERLVGELRESDLDALNPRERYLLRFWLTMNDEGVDAARAVLDEFLAVYPTDFFALEARCDFAWDEQDLKGAETCYRRLVDLHPNWFQAYDRLGHLAMAAGQFSDAEKHFHTYRYITPDQAAPYASTAHLLIILGRYVEAEEMLHKALDLKADHCSAYVNLNRLYSLWGRASDAAAVVDEVEGVDACSWLQERGRLCAMRSQAAYLAGEVEKAWSFLAECDAKPELDVLAHHAAVASGHVAEAEQLEKRLADFLAEKGDSLQPIVKEWYQAGLEHAEGLRLLTAGEAERATELLYAADRRLHYWSAGHGIFKLLNRLTLAYSLELEGKTAKAEAVRHKIEAVNPRLLDDLRLADLERLLGR